MPLLSQVRLPRGAAPDELISASLAHGNHAALYMGQTHDGILVMDQWKNKKEKLVTSRIIRRKGKSKNGLYIQPSDNAEAYFVIE
ncbi:hypothetical protein FHS03_001676 [Massilia violacea]|uniref:BPSL0067 family protein n=2 Tax=Pseudoduganella violacea TaxID=1715466 RepID=A0A7W5B9F3_9BURK|nr:hypothetical protein [Pseudoduganella violacea]